MKPHVVYVTTRFERYYWLTIGVSVALFGGLILIVWAVGYLLSFTPLRWLF